MEDCRDTRTVRLGEIKVVETNPFGRVFLFFDCRIEQFSNIIDNITMRKTMTKVLSLLIIFFQLQAQTKKKKAKAKYS